MSPCRLRVRIGRGRGQVKGGKVTDRSERGGDQQIPGGRDEVKDRRWREQVKGEGGDMKG